MSSANEFVKTAGFSSRARVARLSALNISDEFLKIAEANPKKTAVYWGDSAFSHEHFLRESTAVAVRLVDDKGWVASLTEDSFDGIPSSGLVAIECAQGVYTGDRVAVWMRNCPEFFSAIYGILHAGCVAVPINSFLTAAEVSWILSDAGAEVLIVDDGLAPKLAEILPNHPRLRILKTSEFAGLPRPARFSIRFNLFLFRQIRRVRSLSRSERFPVRFDFKRRLGREKAMLSDNLAIIIYTSGTTGKPKGAMLTHGNILCNVASCRHELETVEQDRMAVLLPLFHSFMLTVGLFLPTLSGGSLALIRSLHPPKKLLAEVIKHEATILPGIPQLFRALAHADLPPLPLRLCISGAAPLPVEVLRQFEKRVRIPLIEGYGLSEASPVVSLNPIHGVRKPGSIGRPIRDVEVSVQDEDGNLLPCGEVGEICVRGGNVMQGYWNRPEESVKTLGGGWLRTGDLGRQDEDGYFFITDRKKDMLLVNGVNVYPREIEEILYQMPGVKEAAVVGKKHSKKGEKPVAFVVVNDEKQRIASDSIRLFLKERLADFKLPEEIHFCEALPRNAAGKILKTELRSRLGDSA